MTHMQIIFVAFVALSLVACSSSTELRAPCGPLTSYVEAADPCGELKPLNAAPFDAIMDVTE